MVTQGNTITASDINAILNKIQLEASTNPPNRGVTNLTTDVVKGDKINSSTFDNAIDTNANINAKHCYCEGEQDGGAGGSGISPTASKLNHDVGDKITAADINKIETDIDALIAQCNCNGYTCLCVGFCGVECSCYTYCGSVCSCDAFTCSCESYTCFCHDEYWVDVCVYGIWKCFCIPDETCSCWGYTCGCQGDCSSVCSCNVDCTQCTCNKRCGCEWV